MTLFKNKSLISLLIAIILIVSSPISAFAITTVTSFTDTLSDSRPAILANHDIKFKMDASTTIVAGKNIAIKFTGFAVGIAKLVQTDFAVKYDADGAGNYTALVATDEYTIDEVSAGPDPVVTIEFTADGVTAIGTNKYIEITFTNGTNKLPNPVADIYTIDINSSTFGDIGEVQVVTIDGQTTNLAVSASLSVSVDPVGTGESVNGATTNITITDPSLFPFGKMTVNNDKIGAIDIHVSTNAAGGYTTSISWPLGNGTSDGLTSGSNNCDGFTNGSATNANPKTWSVNPSGTSANVNTCWYGYTTEDSTLGNGTAGRFTATGGDKWAPFSNIPFEVAYDSVPVNDQITRIGHKVEVNALQPQGAYTGVTEYITTAVF